MAYRQPYLVARIRYGIQCRVADWRARQLHIRLRNGKINLLQFWCEFDAIQSLQRRPETLRQHRSLRRPPGVR